MLNIVSRIGASNRSVEERLIVVEVGPTPGSTIAWLSDSLARVTSGAGGDGDHHALSPQDDAAWKQATGFVNEGRQALSHRDFLTASRYTHKASALASKLPLAPQP